MSKTKRKLSWHGWVSEEKPWRKNNSPKWYSRQNSSIKKETNKKQRKSSSIFNGKLYRRLVDRDWEMF